MLYPEWIGRLQTLVHESPLLLLLWVPPNLRDYYSNEKRLLIERLEKLFPQARLRELGSDQSVSDRSWEDLEAEIMALLSCDLCIVLDGPGDIAEQVTHLTGSGHAHKLYVVSPDEVRTTSGFPNVLREFSNQEFFDPNERGSKLVDRISQRVEQMGLKKTLGDSQHRDPTPPEAV